MSDWIPVTERMPEPSDEMSHAADVLVYIPPHDMRYRCIEAFDIAQADDDGAIIENEPRIHVPVGKEYEATIPGLNLDVWLRAKDGSWLDLDRETFEQCFEEVSE